MSGRDYIRSPMKKAALQLQLTDDQVKRVDKCAAKVRLKSRADFGEHALDFVMPLIEAGSMVNLNGKLVFAADAAKQLQAA